MNKEKYIKLVENCIGTVVRKYYEQPYMFFNEMGIHNYCFVVLYRKTALTKYFSTKDKKRVTLIHPEYNSIKRLSSKRRGWYDIAILNPEFIKNNEFDQICNRKEKNIKQKKGNILAALEFKFITKNDKKNKIIKGLEWDYYKLKRASEALKKYMIVLSNIEHDIFEDYRKEMERKKWNDIKLVFCNVFYDGKDKKRKEILIKPNGWIK